MDDLNDLLRAKGIDSSVSRVLVMRHAPSKQPYLRAALPGLAAKEPEVFNAYQRSQGQRVGKQLSRAVYLASFIGCRRCRAVFVGLYKVNGSQTITRSDFREKFENVRLHQCGMAWPEEGDQPLWFDLAPMDNFSEWMGRLIVQWPSKEGSWTHWAANNTFPAAILPASVFTGVSIL